MSAYPQPSPRRQPSSASSVASSYVSNYGFPESRSTTVTSVSSLSSRFNNNSSPTKLASNLNTATAQGPTGMSQAASIYSNGRESPPLRSRALMTAQRPGATSVRHSFHEDLSNSTHFRFPPPASPSPIATSPTKSPPGSPVKRIRDQTKEFNRRSISFADTSIPDDLSAMRHSSVSHLRTLSLISNGAANEFNEFNEAVGEELVGLQGRRRLQRAQTESLSSWDRLNWMDKRRQYIQAYEYLCHIGEAKEWMEECIGEPIPAIVELEEALRDGVTLAKLVRVFAPELVPRIFDAKKLQFRHSDNINRFFQFVKKVQLPEIFLFELTDLYNKKNIPKVIYCIHALSFLLFRLGMTKVIIGNLVGKLEFTEAEIQNTQKGLDQAGVVLPNFRGVNKHFDPEPEPEPEETEEERIERELGECEFSIKRLQRAARGALVRLRLGDTVEELWSYEEDVIQLQAAIRGMFARISYSYSAGRNAWARELQAVARGYLVRKAIALKLRNFTANERLIVRLQARYRGQKARAETRAQIQRLEKGASNIVGLQAAIRGALVRRSLQVQATQAHNNKDGVTRLQALARGALLRKSMKKDAAFLESKPTEQVVSRLQAKARGMLVRKALLKDAEALTSKNARNAIEDLQAAARGLLVRQAMKQQKQDLLAADNVELHRLQAAIRGFLLRSAVDADKSSLFNAEGTWTKLQAAVRGMLVRQVVRGKQKRLKGLLPSIIKMQAVARGWLARDEYEDMLELLEGAEEEIIDLQALARGYLVRRDFQATKTALKAQVDSVIAMQGMCRGMLSRKHNNAFLAKLQATSDSVARLQAHFRGAVIRGQVADTNAYLEDEEEAVIELQAMIRGKIQRKVYQDKLKFYNDNMQKVIKIQSFVRAKQQGEAYRSLTEGKNPPVGTIKNFVHLLNDSDFDFDEEIEFERLRKNVVQHVAANEMAENYIDQLDIKIALLVKNKITLDEVIKHQKRFTGHVGGLLSNVDLASADPFDLKALNKNSRRKLELYQMLFFALQTQPLYLARLFTNVREQGTPEKDMKRTENLIMGLFGYAQKRREEYYLLKLITRSIKEEVENCDTLEDFLRGNFFWVKLLQSYTRNPKDRKFLKDMLGPILKERILDDRHLNLESDPLKIYHSSIGDEELRTGKKSTRRHSIGREEAIRDPETRATFIERLQYLRDLCSAVLDNLDNSLSKMPYGIRYIAKSSYEFLCEKFPNESPEAVLQIVVHFIFQRYFKPVIVGPDTFGIVAKTLDEKQKRNLGELSKLINQLSLGKQFTHDNIYLLPLNEYVALNIRRMHEIFIDVIAIKDAETQFDIDEFDDLTSTQKPTLYMKMAEIFSIHRLVAQKIDIMSPAREDQLRDIIRELGSVKTNESELRTVSNAEITLYLNPRFQKVEDPDSELKALMVETKRCILYIIRIQTGGDLMEILVKPVRQEDEDRWRQLLEEEHSGKRRGAYADTTTLSDVSSMTYTDLKRTALENIVRLEHAGKITRKNHYQDLLNAIAVDIRTKHRRRVQRQKELENVRGTLSHLNEKATYLEGQLQSYNDYIEQAMQTLQSKKGKRRTILPFTRQYFHIRELQRSGKVPKFGSYNYSARALGDKGVLVALEGYPERQWSNISITIQSDEVGIFRLEMSYGSMIIPGGSMDIPLDDLLQAQFNNTQFMMLFEGMAKVNVNLFLHLLFRKFYRDE